MAPLLTSRQAVEAAVASLQNLLADGDPEDLALREQGQARLADLRAAYRANPKLFAQETIEALKELRDLLEEAAP